MGIQSRTASLKLIEGPNGYVAEVQRIVPYTLNAPFNVCYFKFSKQPFGYCRDSQNGLIVSDYSSDGTLIGLEILGPITMEQLGQVPLEPDMRKFVQEALLPSDLWKVEGGSGYQQDWDKAVKLEKLNLPTCPKVQYIITEPTAGTDGEDAIKVVVVVDQEVKDEHLNGENVLKIKREIRKSFTDKGIELFPYISFTTQDELEAGRRYREGLDDEPGVLDSPMYYYSTVLHLDHSNGEFKHCTISIQMNYCGEERRQYGEGACEASFDAQGRLVDVKIMRPIQLDLLHEITQDPKLLEFLKFCVPAGLVL